MKYSNIWAMKGEYLLHHYSDKSCHAAKDAHVTVSITLYLYKDTDSCPSSLRGASLIHIPFSHTLLRQVQE